MYSGAHKANAPLTNATHVKPADDSMKLLLQHIMKLLLQQIRLEQTQPKTQSNETFTHRVNTIKSTQCDATERKNHQI